MRRKDPGSRWTKTGIVLSPGRPDDDERVLCPCVLPISDGRFRLFYMGRGTGSPNRTSGRVLSAISNDGVVWTKEPGVRLGHHEGAEHRVLSPSIVPAPGGYRMYYEAGGTLGGIVKSATSDDGFVWRPEPGVRLADPEATLGSPRALVLLDESVRVYFHRYPSPYRNGLDAGNHILSAVARDGLTFAVEPGVRIEQTVAAYETEAVYCAQPVDLGSGMIRTFYSGWNGQSVARGSILTALSHDGGLTFTKDPSPVVLPDAPNDRIFASEPCVYRDANGQWRMIYEALGDEGVTHLVSAVAA